MRLKLASLDKIILLLMGFSIIVDMLNGFFIREIVHLPISQGYKLLIMGLMLIRLAPTKDFLSVLFIFLGFQVAPWVGLLKTENFSSYLGNVIVTTKWFMVPLSFFYFKMLFKGKFVDRLELPIRRVFILSFIFLSLNMLLGAWGYGSAFYYEGYPNAAGTKGYIYAGNELTILVLALGFVIASYLYQKKRHLLNALFFAAFLLFAFLITSKTVVGGVTIIFLIPYISSVKWRFNRKWVDGFIGLCVLGLPALVGAFYYGMTRSGFLKTIQYNSTLNEDFLTLLLSNRNTFVIKGWEVFSKDYSVPEQFFGLGEAYHLSRAGDLPELDFITILFSNGILGLLLLLFILLFYFLNARLLISKKGYVYAKPVFVFLLFLCLVANSAGHVFNSGIAGLYIGMAIALMFYQHPSRQPAKISIK